MKTSLFRFLAVWLLLIVICRGATAPADQRTALTAKEVAQGYRDGTILAKPRAQARATVDAAETRESLRVRRKYSRFGDLRVIDLAATDTPAAAISRLKATGRYDFVEPDYLRTASVLPNDTRFTSGDQWNLNNTGQSAGIVGADIKAPAAWDLQTDASNVIVAVLDTGIHATHEDIAANLWTSSTGSHGINAILSSSDPNYGNPDDDNTVGHGTHVAGIIGAVANNGVGIAGVAWRVQIMALKFLNSAGTGNVSDEIECFDYAIAHGAQIINGSFGDETGGSSYSQAELAALTRARDSGIIFVAAAGNDTVNMDVAPHYPASFPLDNIIAVGCSNRRDEASTFSNFGSGAVDLFAPGEQILSLDYSSNTGYRTLSGTSMAAPHVTGILALLRAHFPGDTYHQLINRVYRGADPRPALAGKAQTNGRLNAAASLSTNDNRPFNDDFTTRAKISGSNIAARASNLGATSESGEPTQAGLAGTASIWWEWTAPASGSVTINTTGSTFNTLLSVYTGNTLASLIQTAFNDDSGSSVTSQVTFIAQAGAIYEIAVAGKAGSTGLALLNLVAVPANDTFASPVILTGPSTLANATNVHCSREAGEPKILGFSGGLSLWYQWTAPSTGRFQIAAYSTQIDPLLAVYTGTALNSLTLVSASDNSGLNGISPSSLCTINAIAGTTYLITVDSKNASVPGTFTLSIADSLWQAVTTDNITASPAVAPDGTIYVGSVDNSLYAFAPDGTQKWTVATGGFIDTCSPAIANDGTIYTGSNDGIVRAINPDGSVKWTFPIPTPPSGSGLSTSVSNSPAIAADGTVYIQSYDNNLYAINAADGSQKWRCNTASTSYASPVIAPDGTIYVGSTDNNLYAVNPVDGSVKWRFDAGNQVYSTVALDAAGNLYFGTLGNTFFSVAPTGSQRWVYATSDAISSSPAISADGTLVYFGCYDHLLHAVYTANGTIKWAYPLSDAIRASSPAIDANGVIYIGGYDNFVHAVNPDGTLLRTYATGNWVRSSPVIAGTKLYVGSNDQKLYAFELGVGAAHTPWPMYRHNPRHLGRAVSPPAIVSQPSGHGVALGSTAVFNVAATGGSLTYQWKKDGTAIPGATGQRLLLSNVQSTDAGNYTVTITDPDTGSTISNAATLIVVASSNPGHLVNLSIRSTSGTGDKVLILGFVTGPAGTAGTTPLLIRGAGPSIVPYGVTDALLDPTLKVVASRSSAVVAANDDWGGTPELKAATALTGAFQFISDASKDAAILGNFPSDPYTVVVSSNGGATGTVLAEIYDATPGPFTPGSPRLVNISARAYVSATDNLIAGFVITGDTARTVLIRGVGPDPTFSSAVGGANLGDPSLALYRAVGGTSTLVAANDNWGGEAQIVSAAATVGAFTLSSPISKDAVLLLTLDPGVYTAQVVSVTGIPGIALAEVYEVP